MASTATPAFKEISEEKQKIERALKTAESGAPMRRAQFRRIGTHSVIKLKSDHTEVYYCSDGIVGCLPKQFKSVKVSEILEVRNGWRTDSFQRLFAKAGIAAKAPEDCCFSIIFRHRHILTKSVDLVTDSSEVQQTWVVALRHLIAKIKKEALHFNEEQWLKQNFQEADLNNNGCLSFKEVFALLNKLNLEISQDHAKQMFEKADYKKATTKSKEAGLEFDEFLIFFRYLTKRRYLLKIIREHSTNNNVYFTAQDLKNFIENVQKRPALSVEECGKIIKEFEPDEVNKKETILTVHGFTKFLLSSNYGSVHKTIHKTVFQDMTLPLVNYYVNSTHNTYLSGHQLTGDATIEGYIQTLQEGYKFLELDIWDGDPEPTITHGHTLVTPIRFRDVIQAVNDYAFCVSPYPVILTLENHCSASQQRIMASIITGIFKDKLYTMPPHFTELPSPEALKGKILLKGKVAGYVSPTGVIKSADNFIVQIKVNDVDDNDESTCGPLNSPNSIMSPVDQPKKVPLLAALSELIAMPNVKLKDLAADLEQHPYNGMPSVTEKKMNKFLKDDFTGVVKYTSRHAVKVYPLGTRFGSSNYNPVPFWNAGIQFAPINAQTEGVASDLNAGLFGLNGKCGYVLKPEMLRNGSLDVPSIAVRDYQMTIQLTIISAQYLPKPQTAMTQSDVIDPFVSVEIFGLPFDEQKQITKVVYNNGFNPEWNETFEINLKCPELALLRFSVMDYDRFTSNDFIGEYTLPVISLTEGFSQINLRTGYAHTSDPIALLLVKVNLLKFVRRFSEEIMLNL